MMEQRFLVFFFGLKSTHRSDVSKTSFSPCFVLEEHSTYAASFNSAANPSPCSRLGKISAVKEFRTKAAVRDGSAFARLLQLFDHRFVLAQVDFHRHEHDRGPRAVVGELRDPHGFDARW